MIDHQSVEGTVAYDPSGDRGYPRREGVETREALSRNIAITTPDL